MLRKQEKSFDSPKIPLKLRFKKPPAETFETRRRKLFDDEGPEVVLVDLENASDEDLFTLAEVRDVEILPSDGREEIIQKIRAAMPKAPPPDFHHMSKKDLYSYAEREKIEIPKGKKK